MRKKLIPWAVFALVLILGIVFVMPSIADQVIYHDQCAAKGGVFTYNGKCVEEIKLDR